MNPYKVLGISSSTSLDEARTIYRSLAKRYHPDGVNGDEGKFREVNEAWKLVKDNIGKIKQEPNGFLTHETLFKFRRL